LPEVVDNRTLTTKPTAFSGVCPEGQGHQVKRYHRFPNFGAQQKLSQLPNLMGVTLLVSICPRLIDLISTEAIVGEVATAKKRWSTARESRGKMHEDENHWDSGVHFLES
jgi:hypothetical protein